MVLTALAVPQSYDVDTHTHQKKYVSEWSFWRR